MRKFLNISGLGLILLFISNPSYADGATKDSAVYADNHAKDLAEIQAKAEQGDAIAQYDLSIIYSNGIELPKDDIEALKWCRKSAAQGNAHAEWSLGLKYYAGKGVPQDYSEGVRLFRKSADHGFVLAQIDLGNLYSGGPDGVGMKGVQLDYKEAYFWFTLAGTAVDKKKFEDVESHLSEQQITEVKKRVAEWKPSPAGPAKP